jgi:acyl-coenzyme A synthetase/AMP-(fatty) acid ligase
MSRNTIIVLMYHRHKLLDLNDKYILSLLRRSAGEMLFQDIIAVYSENRTKHIVNTLWATDSRWYI